MANIRRSVQLTQCALGTMLRGAQQQLIDVRPFLLQLDIFENIFNPTLTGSLYLADTLSLTSRLPMTGLDVLFVQFSLIDSQGNEQKYGEGQTLVFHVFNQRDKTFINQGGIQAFRLGLATPEFSTSVRTRISRAYTNQHIESIVQDILKNQMKSKKLLDAEPTSTPVTMAIPYMTPLKAIQFLSERALSKPVNGQSQANYVFFETLKGFRFASISSLIREGKKGVIPVVRRIPGGLATGSTQDDIHMEEMKISHGYDVLHHADTGYFQSRTVALDILAGTYDFIDRSFDTTFGSREHLNGFAPYPSGTDQLLTTPESCMYLVSTTTQSAKKYGSQDPMITPNHLETIVDSRRRQLQELRQQRVVFSAPGHVSLSSGKLIYIQLPQTRSEDIKGEIPSPAEIDPYHSGNHLIVGIKHSLSDVNNGVFYDQTVEAYSDSLSKKL